MSARMVRGCCGGRRVAGRRRCGSGCQRRFSRCARCGYRDEFVDAPTCLSFDKGPVTNLVICWWWLRQEGFIPPPVGALAGGPGPRWHRGRGKVRRTRQRSCAEWLAGAVGDGQIVCGPGDGDDAPVMQPVMVRAYQHQVYQLGQTAVLPVPDVVCV